MLKKFFLLALLLLASCNRYYVLIDQKGIDGCYLASASVGTPDPRCPPCGRMLIVEWHLPSELMGCYPQLFLHVIYRNYTKKIFTCPLDRRTGYLTYFQPQEEFRETCGLLTYMAEVRLVDGSCYCDWRHQLWVPLIQVQEAPPVEPEPFPCLKFSLQTEIEECNN